MASSASFICVRALSLAVSTSDRLCAAKSFEFDALVAELAASSALLAAASALAWASDALCQDDSALSNAAEAHCSAFCASFDALEADSMADVAAACASSTLVPMLLTDRSARFAASVAV